MRTRTVIRSWLAAALSLALLAGSAEAQLPSGNADVTKVKEAALRIPTGSPVRVQMKDKSKVTGKIGALDNDGFDLQMLENGQIVSKKIAFERVAKLTSGTPAIGFRRVTGPVLAVISMVGTAAALTAAIK